MTELAKGLRHPWGIAFLPDGQALITERTGQLRLLGPQGLSSPLTGVPEIKAEGQGGLLDVAIPPEYPRDPHIYLTYAAPAPEGSQTVLARGKLGANGIEGLTILFRQQPAIDSDKHYGSRVVFAPDGTLWLTLGERGQQAMAQQLNNHMGKVVRLNRDGSVPIDNPFVGRADALPEIWSYGHRNPQGAAVDARGQLWVVEHGARGGDEVNRVEKGANYGWPEIAYGTHYNFLPIGRGTHAPGMVQPEHYWDPSIAPGGAMIYTGAMFPEWRGQMLVAALKYQLVSRLTLSPMREEDQFLKGLVGRIRQLAQAPDGSIWLLTDSGNGRVLRLTRR